MSVADILAYDSDAYLALQSKRDSIMSDIHSGRIPQREIADIPLKYLDLTRLPGVPAANIMTPSVAFKPFRYDFAFKMMERQNQTHWVWHKVDVELDLRDWKTKLSDAEKHLVTHIFPLFVQNDVLVNNVYLDQYAKIFRPNELLMAFSAIANMEAIHQTAYSHMLDGLGFRDEQYSGFMEYQEMSDKYNFTAGFRMDSLMGIALAMLVFGALTEGVQLFASFLTLFNFTRFNKLKGMGQVVSWSVRDESLHVSFVAKIFESFVREFGHLLDLPLLAKLFTEACQTIVKGEHKFTDLAFGMGGVEGLEAQNVKNYIENIADMRMQQFGFDKVFGTPMDPVIGSFINNMMGGIEHVNFFENIGTDYSKASTKGSWAEVWDSYPKATVAA
jgi:ribonucleoside-diphosphate reductase beta chain